MNRITTLLCCAAILAAAAGCRQAAGPDTDPARWVDPFIGTADNGHTFPGATLPFGLIQPSPETGTDSWRYCVGYNIADDSIIGFANTHFSGGGCQELGDILMLPFCGEQVIYKSLYDRSTQAASPGYYTVALTGAGVKAELTAAHHTGMHRYTYTGQGKASMLLDMQSGLVWNPEWTPIRVLDAQMQMPDNHTITGHQQTANWVKRRFFYAIRFEQPYTVREELPKRDEREKGRRLVLEFDLKSGEVLQAKVAVSTVSVEGALASMDKEIPDWDFDKVHRDARATWNELLGRVQVTGSDDQKVNFYTSLYHMFLQPADITDTDGRYRGVDDSVRMGPGGHYYSTLSLWDTYRAVHPLYTILSPEIVDGVVNSMVAHYQASGALPVWPLWGQESWCMVGNHAVPVIVEAWRKGFRGFDERQAYEAVRGTLTAPHFHSDWAVYDKYGYYPFDIMLKESASTTIESCYDDYAASLMAAELGTPQERELFTRRSGYWRNLFDPETKLIRGRDSKGAWRTPYNPYLLSFAAGQGGDFTEGNAWNYSWHVQHDPEGLMALMGGPEAFAAKLDTLFTKEVPVELTGTVADVSTLPGMGQYAHSNEPSHHCVYLYQYAGRPDRTQELVRRIVDLAYQPRPDGLCGNDDAGQMSAWYVFAAMGFYPVDPVSCQYVLGAPQVEKVVLSLPGGKQFTVEARGLSAQNKYVRKVELNGHPLEGLTLSHDQIMAGGKLVFHMTAEPNR